MKGNFIRMRIKDICAKCVWCDQCEGDENCELSPIDEDTTYEDEYLEDLKARELTYLELIIEMNGGEPEYE